MFIEPFMAIRPTGLAVGLGIPRDPYSATRPRFAPYFMGPPFPLQTAEFGTRELSIASGEPLHLHNVSNLRP